MALRTGWFLLGLGLIGAGSILLVRALDRQAGASVPPLPEHPATGAVFAQQAKTPVNAPAAAPAATASSTGAASPADGHDDAPEPAMVKHSNAPDGSPDGSFGTLARSGPGERVVFRFPRGGVQLANDEQQRLVAVSKKLARLPAVRIDIAGYNDDEEPDLGPKSAAYRRALSVQRLLVYLGIAASRLTYGAHAQAASDTAQTVTLTLDPPTPEVTQP